MLNIQINGIDIQAPQGSMIIEAAKLAGINIPHFCYHKKLSTAASCRMCLVEVEKIAKTVPACTTPIGEGMKIYTNSAKALSSQRGVMEFLLINHPLDCPICDQGGECPLQETAMGFGEGISRYIFTKRVVSNPEMGPLVAADMTRCIHCTRCIRFTREIAGVMDLGAIKRGEQMAITTYEGHPLTSELSGNIIDLCPVGALTSKPARFTARAWELQSYPGIGPHDSFGSHLRIDVRKGRVIRVAARECEDINENWISDRDRFSYQGLYSNDRLKSPRIKEKGIWREVDWSTALEFVVNNINEIRKKYGANALGAIAAPTATLEENFLLQKLVRALGSPNIDHRLRQIDFSYPEHDPIFPWLGCPINDLEQHGAFLIIGSNLRKEHPLINHRVRKAMVWNGGHTMFLDAIRRDYNYSPSAVIISPPSRWLQELIAIAKAAHTITKRAIDPELAELWKNIEPGVDHHTTAEYLINSGSAVILLGNLAQSHPNFSELRIMATILAELTGAILGYLPESSGTVGAWLAGCIPHRGPGGKLVSKGKDWQAMLSGEVKGLLVFGAELDRDCNTPNLALHSAQNMDLVVSFSSWTSPAQENYANVLLPIASYAETSGTYINLEGRWQSFKGVTAPLGNARPGWKVLRVLANMLNIEGWDYFSSEEVLIEAQQVIGAITPNNRILEKVLPGPLKNNESKEVERIKEIPPYLGDALVRRAEALQNTHDGKVSVNAYLHPITVNYLGLGDAKSVIVKDGFEEIELPLIIDNRIAEGCVAIPAGISATSLLDGVAVQIINKQSRINE